MVDTNYHPRSRVCNSINDDASKSIDKILSLVTAAIVEGLSDRGSDKEADATEKRFHGRKAVQATETAARLHTVTQQLKNKTNLKYLNSKFQKKKLETFE
jgi:small subunit ribosomal protein S2